MKSRIAFTMSEILIALGIIGIVAVITVPTLVMHYQQRSWNTSATVFERELGEALAVMNTQNTLAGYNTTEAFIAELSKHMKLVNTCDKDALSKCFETNIIWDNSTRDISSYKLSKKFGHENWNTNIVGIQTTNGYNALIAYNPECISDPYSNQIITFNGNRTDKSGSVSLETDCIALLYDTTGYSKPNEQGKDIRSFNVKLPICLKEGSICFAGSAQRPVPIDCTDTESDDSQYCLGNTQSSEDYWAGAVKLCGDVDKLPSTAMLTEIVNYVYGISCNGDCSTPTWNEEMGKRAAEFGLPSAPAFWVRSKGRDSYTGGVGSGRSFFPSRSYTTFAGNSYKGDKSGYVLCIDD